jgi:hypothetical protein
MPFKKKESPAKKAKAEEKPAEIVPDVETLNPSDDWEEKRKKKVDLFYENALFDVGKTRKFNDPDPWMKKMYPGMEFAYIPSDPRDIGRYVNPDRGWEPIPAPTFISSQDGRIHKGDTVACMRPVEIGVAVRQREDRERDIAHGNITQNEAVKEMEQRVKDYNRRFRKPRLTLGDDTTMEIMTDPGGPDAMAERDESRRGGQDDDDTGPREKKYFSGYGPSKIFNSEGG